jgi:transposase
MKKTKRKTRTSYSPDFKEQAIQLAKEIGTQQAAGKLGIENYQTLAAWLRYSKKIDENNEIRQLEEAKAEIKKLRKQVEEDKKVIAILRDATAFFCQNQSK